MYSLFLSIDYSIKSNMLQVKIIFKIDNLIRS